MHSLSTINAADRLIEKKKNFLCRFDCSLSPAETGRKVFVAGQTRKFRERLDKLSQEREACFLVVLLPNKKKTEKLSIDSLKRKFISADVLDPPANNYVLFEA